MPVYSRRKFLERLGAFSAVVLAGRNAFSLHETFAGSEDFEMLIIGDSLIGGQGLKEKDKFYTLTKNWLQTEVFKGNRQVNVKSKAHSGARIFLGEDEVEALQEAEKELDEFYHPEINFSFPSVKTQVEVAKREYIAEGKKPEDVDLIMLSGGITGLGTSYINNPFKKSKPLREKIKRYCNEEMSRFLGLASDTFPNAFITVVGYYPMVSSKSSSGAIYNSILELYKFPGLSKPLLNNILTKQFFKILHGKMSKRSRIWASESTRELQNAVDRLNSQFTKKKAVFIKSPITEDSCFETKNTLLWRMGKKGRSEDDMYDVRQIECPKAIERVKDVDLEFKQRFCELSGLGHPNVEGSRAYAEAVRKELARTLFNDKTTSVVRG